MNVWVWIVGAAVQSTVSVLVSMYWRRAIHRNTALLEQVLSGVEGAVAITYTKGTRVNLAKYHKAIAAGSGSLLAGLLVYAETNDLEPILGPLLPAQWRPLLGWFLGAIIVVTAVIASKKNTEPAAAVVAAEPAPGQIQQTIAERRTIASLAKPVDDEPFWGGVQATGTDNVSSMTSKVQLQPVPTGTNR